MLRTELESPVRATSAPKGSAISLDPLAYLCVVLKKLKCEKKYPGRQARFFYPLMPIHTGVQESYPGRHEGRQKCNFQFTEADTHLHSGIR